MPTIALNTVADNKEPRSCLNHTFERTRGKAASSPSVGGGGPPKLDVSWRTVEPSHSAQFHVIR